MYTEEYKNALCLICRQNAILEKYNNIISSGGKVCREEIQMHLDLFVKAKESFLEAKKALGYTDGLAFLQNDSAFYGFRFQQGSLSGDYEYLTKILIPWTESEESEENHYKYEVGTLVLSHYFMQLGRYEYQKKQTVKERMKKLWDDVKKLFHRKGGFV